MRYVSLFFFFCYILFAYWQLNDPDPVWWVTLYLIPAYISWRTFKNKHSFSVLPTLIIIYAAYAINTFLQITNYEGIFMEGGGLSMKTLNQELAREGMGLLICIFTFMMYAIYFYAREKNWFKKREDLFVQIAE